MEDSYNLEPPLIAREPYWHLNYYDRLFRTCSNYNAYHVGLCLELLLNIWSNDILKHLLVENLHYRPDEYNDLWLRHVYYDLVSYLLMYPMDKSWNKIKKIRFFDAVNITTGQWGLASARSVAAKLSVSAATVSVITEINRTLFAENMIIIKNLFYDIKFPFAIPQ